MENKVRMIPVGNESYIVKHNTVNKIMGVKGAINYLLRTNHMPDNQDTACIKNWLRSCSEPNSETFTKEIFWFKGSNLGRIAVDWIVDNPNSEVEECFKYPDQCGYPWNSKVYGGTEV